MELTARILSEKHSRIRTRGRTSGKLLILDCVSRTSYIRFRHGASNTERCRRFEAGRRENIEGSMLFKRLQEDLDAFLARDPAARSRLEIALCYPGFHVLLFFRLSAAPGAASFSRHG